MLVWGKMKDGKDKVGVIYNINLLIITISN